MFLYHTSLACNHTFSLPYFRMWFTLCLVLFSLSLSLCDAHLDLKGRDSLDFVSRQLLLQASVSLYLKHETKLVSLGTLITWLHWNCTCLAALQFAKYDVFCWTSSKSWRRHGFGRHSFHPGRQKHVVLPWKGRTRFLVGYLYQKNFEVISLLLDVPAFELQN